jgi:heptaprenyl diphosphate synthase
MGNGARVAAQESSTRNPGPSTRSSPIARLAVLVACASVLQVAESLLPHPLPGVRIGLANIITIVALAELGPSWALQLAFYRSLVSSLVLGTFLAPAFVLSLGGGLASALVMMLVYAAARRVPGLGLVGVSVAGAVSHIVAQLALVYFVFVRSAGVLWLAPWLVLSAVATGLLTGLVAVQALRRLEEGERGTGNGERVTGNGARVAEQEPLARDPEPLPTGPLARVRPEYKVSGVVLVALPVVIFNRVEIYAGALALILVVAAVGRVRLVGLLAGLRRTWSLVALAFAVPALANGWGRILVQVGPVRVTDAGLMAGGLFAARLVVLLFATRLLALSTAPADVALGLARLLSPLRRFGLNPGAVGEALSLSWAYFPVLWRRALESVRARRGRQGWFNRVVNLPGDIVADLYRFAGQLTPGRD